MPKRKAWTKTVELHGQRVRLYQRGATIYREVRTANGKDRKSLGHGDRDMAVEQAEALCEHLADLAINPDKAPDSLTLGRLRRLYLASEGDGLSRQRKRFIKTTLGMLEAHLGEGFPVVELWRSAIRWRAAHDKVGRQTFAPVPARVAEAVTAYMRKSGRIGDAWLFPRDKDGEAIDKQHASYWLRRAEKLAGLPHVRRGGWHAFRRAWAHRNKHKSPHDVAAVGGWFDLGALQDAYQSADPASMMNVVNGDG